MAVRGHARHTPCISGCGGFLGEEASDQNLSAAIGLAVARGQPQPDKVMPDPAGRSLSAGLNEPFGTDTVLDPLWVVEEEGVEVLGRYPDGGVAAAARQTPEGLRAYIGALHCPAKLLRNLLKASGIHLYSDSDDVVLTDGTFFGFTATSPGAKRLVFPGPRTVIGALDGQEIARQVDHLDVEMALGETRLYRLMQ